MSLLSRLARAARWRPPSADRSAPNVMVNGPCDLSCAWCNIAGTRTYLPQDELERVTRELERLAACGAREACFGLHHTEPTTLPELPEILSRARSLGFERTILSTSGMNIAERAYLERLVVAGLDAVIVTVVTLDRARSDLLLGRPGATDRKLRAIRNCVRQGLDVVVPMMLLRPALGGVPDAVRELRALGDGYGGNFDLHGCLMDYVHDRSSARHRLLWPTYPEIRRTMNRVARVDPSFGVLSKDMPLCVRKSMPGVDRSSYRMPAAGFVRPEAICGSCHERHACGGVPEHYVEHLPREARSLLPDSRGQEPPSWSLEDLEASLRGCVAAQHADGEETASRAWTAGAREALLGVLQDADHFDGFCLAALEEGSDRLTIRFRRASESLSFVVEPAANARRFYLKGARFALSYHSDTPVDSAAKRAVAETLLSVVHERVAESGVQEPPARE